MPVTDRHLAAAFMRGLSFAEIQVKYRVESWRIDRALRVVKLKRFR